MDYRKNALDLIKVHEGYEQYPYKCSMGIQTIGYGRNLESRGLSEDEAAYLLACDIRLAEGELMDNYEYFWSISGVRKAILIDMMVNLGSSRLSKFKKMHQALGSKDYELAADEMLDSRWASQVGNRALTLAQAMRSNRIEEGLCGH